jgi:hypothetical protein
MAHGTLQSSGSAQVAAFACAQCEGVHRTSKEADKCCLCEECGTKFPHRGYGSRCGHCCYGGQLREARRRVRHAEDELDRAKTGLAKMLADKRPAKGSAS